MSVLLTRLKVTVINVVYVKRGYRVKSGGDQSHRRYHLPRLEADDRKRDLSEGKRRSPERGFDVLQRLELVCRLTNLLEVGHFLFSVSYLQRRRTGSLPVKIPRRCTEKVSGVTLTQGP